MADVYDALRCKRVYKHALPHEECVRLISEETGAQFDPRVVEAFLRIHDRFGELADQFQNIEQPSSDADLGDINPLCTVGVEHVPSK